MQPHYQMQERWPGFPYAKLLSDGVEFSSSSPEDRNYVPGHTASARVMKALTWYLVNSYVISDTAQRPCARFPSL